MAPSVSICVRSVNSTRFGVWVTDVSVLSDMTAADLDDLIENSNSQCEDLGNGLPLQSYLRASDLKSEAETSAARLLLAE